MSLKKVYHRAPPMIPLMGWINYYKLTLHENTHIWIIRDLITSWQRCKFRKHYNSIFNDLSAPAGKSNVSFSIYKGKEIDFQIDLSPKTTKVSVTRGYINRTSIFLFNFHVKTTRSLVVKTLLSRSAHFCWLMIQYVFINSFIWQICLLHYQSCVAE